MSRVTMYRTSCCTRSVNDDFCRRRGYDSLHARYDELGALDVHNHGNISKKIDLVKDFAESEKMELNPKKW